MSGVLPPLRVPEGCQTINGHFLGSGKCLHRLKGKLKAVAIGEWGGELEGVCCG